MAIIDELKNKVKEAEQLVIDTRIMYCELEQRVKDGEKALRHFKSDFNRSHKNWVRAKKLVIKTKAKLSRYPRETRVYAKNPMDKVFNILEKS